MTLLVCSEPVLARYRAVYGADAGTDWVDASTVTDAELAKAPLVELVVANGTEDALRYAIVGRLQVMGKPGSGYMVEVIEAIEYRAAERAAAADESARARALMKAGRKARRQLDQEIEAELVEEKRLAELDAAAKDFAWDDLAASWKDEPPAPEHLSRGDGQAAFYRSARNMLIGYSESGKTWVAMLAVRQEVEAGRPVALFDFENGPSVIVDRLRRLGLSREQVARYVRYTHLSVPLPAELAGDLAAKLLVDGGRVVIIDALTPAAQALGLEVHGGNVNATEELFSLLMDPWTEAGHACVLLDNTPRSSRADTLGSQHKTAGVDCILAVVAEDRFSRHHKGCSKVLVVKDRIGSVDYVMDKDRRLWAELSIGPDPVDPELVNAHLVPPPEPAVTAAASVAAVVDIVEDTCRLAAESLRRNGVTECHSMRRLVDWMVVVHGIDPSAFAAAHLDRRHITNCLTKVADKDTLADAGLGIEVIATPGSTRFRVWLT